MAATLRGRNLSPLPNWLAAIGIILLFCIGLANLACGGMSSPEIAPPARVILFSMDTVRADLVSGYGAANNTPVLAEIAGEGVLFRNSYAASTYTIPSHMSIFTGLDPIEHAVLDESSMLDPRVPVLAEILKAAGLRTRAFHEGGYVAARFGFDRGFDTYSQLKRLAVVEDRLESILDWIRSAADDRYFLFLHTFAAHFPYGGFESSLDDNARQERFSEANVERWREMARTGALDSLSEEELYSCMVFNNLALRRTEMIHGCGHRLPPGFAESANFEADRQAILTSYTDRIRLIDAAIGRIRDTLLELGQWDDTLLIVLGDHGEAFFEHGLQRHGYVPFNEVLRVPLIVSYPSLLRDRGGLVSEGLVWHLDILPTISSLMGIPLPAEMSGGVDLTPVLTGQQEIPADRAVHPVVLHAQHTSDEPMRRVALRRSLKYVEGARLFGDEAGLLFELGSDPDEMRNLRQDRPEAFASMAEVSDRHLSTLTPGQALAQSALQPGVTEDAETEGLSQEAEEQLRELGYIE